MEEFAAYGERVGSFHIKDRVRGGKTVPLGQGDTDFASLRAARSISTTRVILFSRWHGGTPQTS
jgi:sugar phosphate isomerase/epimerase